MCLIYLDHHWEGFYKRSSWPLAWSNQSFLAPAPPFVARETLRAWQEKNHPWLELSDVHRETTENIRVTVIPFYMGMREAQNSHVYWWRYCIRLENLDNDVVQLRERHWRIFSLSGTLETVRGRGVVGRVSIFGLMILVSGLTQQAWELKAWSPPLWLGTGSVYESTGLLRVRKLTVREASYNPFHRW